MGRWDELFPWPLVGVSVLLVALIFLTPNLLSAGGGPAAGSLETQAELVVDAVAANPPLHLYVHGIGLARYASIAIGVGTNVTWPAPASADGLAFPNGTQANATLALGLTTAANPVAVNVTAVYVDAAGTTVWYRGTFVFYLSGGTLFTAPLLPGAASVAPTPAASLPLPLLLAASTTGASP